MTQEIDQKITTEIAKIPARLRDNFLVRATINSQQGLGPESALEQLKDINKNARGKSTTASAKLPELTNGLKRNIRAGAKKIVAPNRKRKAQ